MRIYLDTSVIAVYLFGKHSETEAGRLPPVKKLFDLINAHKVSATISLYTVQEIYSFCRRTFGPEDAGHISRSSLAELFTNDFELAGLLTREERLLHRVRFAIDDLSDQPHVISAYLTGCDAIVTYDRHFQKIKKVFAIYVPEEIIGILSPPG